MEKTEILFERWFARPLGVLESLPNGDGGFVALAIACMLYERYAVSVITRRGGKINETAKRERFAEDFATDSQTAEVFWNTIRNGLMHGAMPKQAEYGKRLPGYVLHHSFPQAIDLSDWGGQPVLRIQPWRFTNRVIELWQDNVDLLDQSPSFPWPNIF
jgi:hypothetical protein